MTSTARRTSFFASTAALLLLGACSPPGVSNLGGTDAGGDPTPTPTSTQNGAVTYYKDLLPVLHEHCSGCHTQGGVGGFALDTYEAAKPMAAGMLASIEAKSMPPFPPDADCNEYVGENVIDAAEKEVFKAWIAGGLLAGDPADAPPPPPPPATLGTPDKMLDPGGDYTFDPNANQDLYWCFRLDPGITTATDFVAAEVLPGNDEIVHHVIVFREANGQANPTGLPGFECGGAPGEFMFAWVPGSGPLTFPEGVGMRIQPNDRLLMQMHYSRVPNAASQVDRTRIGIHWAEQPVENLARVSWLGTIGIDIPPNSEATATSECEVGGPVQILSAAPHMHTLATGFKGNILRANGTQECLIDIPRWDFNWQGGYQFKQPIQLDEGDRITSECRWYNNTDAQVGFGEGTGDEMCFNFVYVVGPTGDMPQYCFPGGGLFDIFANGGLGFTGEQATAAPSTAVPKKHSLFDAIRGLK